MRRIRGFFEARDVLELDTPLLASHAVTDVHLDSMRLESGHYLNTSPEYCMKRFVAEHRRDAWQICKSFRQGEAGRWHNPEFTMLEWYRVGFALEQLIDEVEALLDHIADGFSSGIDRFERVSYGELFESVTGIDPHRTDAGTLAQYAVSAGIERPQGLGFGGEDVLVEELDRDAWLDWLMSVHVTPQFEHGVCTCIVDYPASQAALARLEMVEGVEVARRFEIYLGPLELANGYHELTEPAEQSARFDRDNDKRQRLGKPPVEKDPRLLEALGSGLPDCAGVAVGLDRCLAAILGQEAVSEAISYTWTKV